MRSSEMLVLDRCRSVSICVRSKCIDLLDFSQKTELPVVASNMFWQS